MNEYLVKLFRGVAYVYADRWTKDGGTYYFLVKDRVVKTFAASDVKEILNVEAVEECE